MEFMFIQGIPDNKMGQVHVGAQGQISIELGGSSNIYPFMDGLPGRKHIFYMNNGKAPQDFNLDYWPDVIINEISDADSHQTALARCEQFCKQQAKPVINPPALIRHTTRDGISQLLQNTPGLQMPLTLRINPKTPDDVAASVRENNFRYPVIFRQVGDHGGISTVLLEKETSIAEAMHAYALDGRTYYLTQYNDYASGDSLYRKYRIVMISGIPYLRHMIVSDTWLIHSSSRSFMREDPRCQQEESMLLETFREQLAPRLGTTLNAIDEKLQLDYYGIDCNINSDYEMLAFEINSNMNVLTNNQPSPNKWERPLDEIRQAIQAMIVNKARTAMPS